MARVDLPKAVALLVNIPTHPSGPRLAVIDQLGLIMAKENPADAYAWLQEVGLPSRGATVYIGQHWATQEPHQFPEQLDNFPVSAKDKAGLLGTAIAGLWQQNPDEATAYLNALELPENEAQIVEKALARVTRDLLWSR